MSFELLKGTSVYLEEETTTQYWENGILKESDPVVNYTPIPDCMIESVVAEEASLLPEGTRLKDSRWLFTSAVLNVYQEDNTNASEASKIYLTDPEATMKKPACYVVYDREHYDTYDDFELISDEYTYLLVREGKV